MRYFRYKNTNKTEKNALKEQYASLTKDEKRIFRKHKFWTRVSIIISLSMFFGCLVGCMVLLSFIPQPENPLLATLFIIGTIVLAFVSLIVSIFIAYVVSLPFGNMVKKYDLPYMKREIISKACAHLRDYYELQEPCLVTKCYDASNKNFMNHDVCIFVVGEELRITADLKRGFLHGERDLGCYAFKAEEISLSKKQGEQYLIAELKADNVEFLLGYRAKGFIEKFVLERGSLQIV